MAGSDPITRRRARGWQTLALVVAAAALLVVAAKASRAFEQVRVERAPAPGSWDRPVEVIEEGDGYRFVRHAAGTTRVPSHPERICALAAADELLALGVTPVAHSINDGNFPDYLADALADVPWIPNVYGAHLPNMEAVIATRPDLIITRTLSRQTYRQLTQIAPTVVVLDHLEFYRQRVLDVGAIIGRPREAAARVAWYDAKVAAARAAIHPVLAGGSIAMLHARPTAWRLHGGDHHTDPLLYDDLGVAKPRLVAHRRWSSTASPEGLLHLDADWILTAIDVDIGSARRLADLVEHPIWARLPAVRAGRVHAISKYRHWSDAGILGRARAIDDVVRAVAPAALEAVAAAADAAWRRALD